MIVLERGRARARVFPSRTLMGGTSLLAPLGATTITPAAPLDFSGFDTLAVKFHIAGLSGGDAVALRLNTVDPESATGAEIPGAAMASTILTANANGDWAGMIDLKALYSTGPQALVPAADVAPPPGLDWGKTGGSGAFYTFLNATAPNLGATKYVTWGPGSGSSTLSLSLATGVNPNTTAGWMFQITARCTIPQVHVRMELNIANNPGITIIDKFVGGPSNTDVPVLSNLTSSFQQITYNLSGADAAKADFTKQPWLFNMLFSGAASSGEFDFAQAQLVVPAANGGIVSGAPPFYLNVFDFVNTGAHDATITAFEATLTNARRRPWA